MSAALHYLYLFSGGLITLRDEADGLKLSGHFERPAGHGADDAAGTAPAWADGFAQLLDTHRRDRYVWLVDTVDEELQLEQLPRMRGSDLRKFTARRLEQRFRSKNLATWRPGAAATRRGWRAWLPAAGETMPVLLAALGSEQLMQPWLSIAERAKVVIEGIHSPALLARALARRIVPDPTGLLVSLHPAGLRQTLLVDGGVRFTRLAAIGAAPGIDAVRLECERALQYLLMTQVVSRPLITGPEFRLWLAADGTAEASRMPSALQIDNTTRLSVGLIDAAAFGAPAIDGEERTGEEPTLGAVAMWLQPALWQRRSDGYAIPRIRLHAQIAQRRRWMLGSAQAALVIALAGNAAVELVDRFGDEDARLLAKLQTERRERDRLQQQVADAAVNGAEMRRVVELDATLRERTMDAGSLLTGVARALAPDDSLKLRRMSWSRGELSDGGSGGPAAAATATPALAMPAAAMPFGSAPAAAPPAMPATTTDDGARAHARIIGEFEQVPAMLEANRRVEAFARRLAAQCGCDAKVRRLPYDPEPTQAYSGGRQAGVRERTAFEIDLHWDAQATTTGRAAGPGGHDVPKS
ncbi:MAG TPA: hypothetical protein PKA20_07650 [Burkholderiaceae bacterium]|nr:hypothetical protein [Burkholderiaceae bacterium]